MKLHIHRPHPKSWFHRKHKVEAVVSEVVVPVVVEPTKPVKPDKAEKVKALSKRALRSKTIYDCQRAIDDAYKMYDKAVKKADKEYTDALQPINSAFYTVLRYPTSTDNSALSDARKKYWVSRTEAEARKQASISMAGAVLDVEIKHQNELIDELG